jgi:hypothetical protein
VPVGLDQPPDRAEQGAGGGGVAELFDKSHAVPRNASISSV